jgi:hypothetical protein
MAEEEAVCEVSIRDIVARFASLSTCPNRLRRIASLRPTLTRSCMHRFIAASPSGELQFVLSDLRGLVNQDEFDLHAELPALVAE